MLDLWRRAESDHRKTDYDQARAWALKTADQGVAAAMTRLGLLYHVAVRDSCSPEGRRAAERQVSLPIEAAEVPQ